MKTTLAIVLAVVLALGACKSDKTPPAPTQTPAASVAPVIVDAQAAAVPICELGRAAVDGAKCDKPEAQAVFLTGVGMPTIDILGRLERDLGKPAISSSSAMMWHALRIAGVNTPIEGYGRLLSQP